MNKQIGFRFTLLSSIVFAILLQMPTPTYATGATRLYSTDSTGNEVRFGGSIGAGAKWKPSTPQRSLSTGFGGRVTLTCSGLDYQGFLKSFDPNDYLKEMKNQFISGAQSAVTNFLITTAYSNPTIASVLDMANRGYSEKFSAFQSLCNAQEAKQRGLASGARQMAASQNQCYEDQVNRGKSPTQAYQLCANESTFGSIASALPAGRSTGDFLKTYTSINFTKQVETLLSLLSDERVTDQGYEMSPPKVTLHELNTNVESRTTYAIDAVLDGTAPSSIPDCKVEDYLVPSTSKADACLPETVAGIIQSPAFLAARQLSPEGRKLYADAMSSQLSISTIRGSILDLMSQVKQMDVKGGAGADAPEVLQRKKSLEDQIANLQKEAEAFQNFQQAKATAIRTQILTMDMINRNVAKTENATTPRRTNRLSFDAITSLFTSK